MSLLDFIREYKELLAALITGLFGLIGRIAVARIMRKRELRITHRIEHAGAPGDGSASRAPSSRPPVRLETSWWDGLQMLTGVVILSAIFGGLGAFYGSFLIFFGVTFALVMLLAAPFFLWHKLAGPRWTVDARGITIERFGRTAHFDWSEIDAIEVKGWLTIHIGHEAGGYTRSISMIPDAQKMRAVAFARSAGVRVKEIDIGGGISIAGQHLANGDISVPLGSIRGISLTRPVSSALKGVLLLVVAAGLLFVSLGGFIELASEAEPQIGLGWSIGLGVGGVLVLLTGMAHWHERDLEVQTAEGKQLKLADKLSSSAAQTIRSRILTAKA